MITLTELLASDERLREHFKAHEATFVGRTQGSIVAELKTYAESLPSLAEVEDSLYNEWASYSEIVVDDVEVVARVAGVEPDAVRRAFAPVELDAAFDAWFGREFSAAAREPGELDDANVGGDGTRNAVGKLKSQRAHVAARLQALQAAFAAANAAARPGLLGEVHDLERQLTRLDAELARLAGRTDQELADAWTARSTQEVVDACQNPRSVSGAHGRVAKRRDTSRSASGPAVWLVPLLRRGSRLAPSSSLHNRGTADWRQCVWSSRRSLRSRSCAAAHTRRHK
jgi:hypothetical protein